MSDKAKPLFDGANAYWHESVAECPDISFEELYQAFKARLMKELYAKCPSCATYVGKDRTPGALLHERDNKG